MTQKHTEHISVIGAGAWGTALAQAIARKGTPVTLWAREPKLAQDISDTRENTAYLPGIPLDKHITATSDLAAAARNEILLLVPPAQAVRATLEKLKPFITDNHIIILCSKGIELDTEKLLSDIAREALPRTPLSVLTGPNFAREIAQGKPAATTLACADRTCGELLQNAIGSKMFRPYLSEDIIGAQIAGALKNVIAIACGIAHGLDMGESARASLVTRGLAEIARLGHAMGAQTETFMGLCGIGDLMLTCSSEQSRNFSLGSALGRGENLDAILGARRSVTEGVHTARAAVDLARRHAVDMPICTAVHKCLNLGLSLDEALEEMLNRPLGNEL